MTGTGFRRIANVSATTKRMSSINGTTGLAGTSGPYLTGLYVTPPVPLSTPVSARNDITMLSPILENPFELLQSFIEGAPDIKKGDTLIVYGKAHKISFIEDWSLHNDHRLRLILERPDEE